MVTSVFDETWSELILATRRIFLYVTGKKKRLPALGQANGFFTLKTHFTPKNEFYTEKKKAPAALGQA